jgi:hypothetical protein
MKNKNLNPMKIIQTPINEKENSLNKIRGGKEILEVLHTGEKDLLHMVAETFTLVTGGNFKKRKNIA